MEPFLRPLQRPFWQDLFTRRCRFLWRLWLSNKSYFQNGVKLATLIWSSWIEKALALIQFAIVVALLDINLFQNAPHVKLNWFFRNIASFILIALTVAFICQYNVIHTSKKALPKYTKVEKSRPRTPLMSYLAIFCYPVHCSNLDSSLKDIPYASGAASLLLKSLRNKDVVYPSLACLQNKLMVSYWLSVMSYKLASVRYYYKSS